jgi:hypothetical protein
MATKVESLTQAVPRTAPGFVDGDNTYLLPQAPALTYQDSDLSKGTRRVDPF